MAVGYGKVNLAHAADAVLIDQSRTGVEMRRRPPAAEAPPAARRPTAKRSIAGVRVQGEADILVRFAKCCTPGARRRDRRLHQPRPRRRRSTPATARRRSTWTRRGASTWRGTTKSKTLRPVAVQVVCTDRPGLLAAISKAFTEHGVNISQAKCRTTEDGRAVNTFQVTVGHLEQLKTVLRSLTTIEGVVSATRL